MLFRSTGLGKTQLTGQVVEMKRQGDYLIMHVDVTDPVKWRIRAAMSFRDLAKVMACCVNSLLPFRAAGQYYSEKWRHYGEV